MEDFSSAEPPQCRRQRSLEEGKAEVTQRLGIYDLAVHYRISEPETVLAEQGTCTLGGQPMSVAPEGYGNVAKPSNFGDFTARVTFKLLFPSKR